MRCLFLIDELETGGSQKQILELARGLRSCGHDVHVVYFRKGKDAYTPDFVASEIPVSLVEKSGWVDPTFLFRLVRKIRGYRPDVAVTYNPTADIWGMVASWIARVPTRIVSLRSVKIVEESSHLRFLYKVIRWLPRLYIGNSAAGIVDFIRFVKIPADRFHHVPNGMRLSEMTPPADANRYVRGEFQIPNDVPIIICVGRLVQDKGHEVLIRALSRVKSSRIPFCCLLVGGGPLRKELEEQVRELSLSGEVIFTGERKDIWRLIAPSTVFVLPSWREGLSNSIIEALCFGLPVVCTRVGGNEVLVTDGVNGYLVPPGDDAELSRRISHLLTDHALRGRMMAEAVKIREWVDSEKMTDNFLVVLRKAGVPLQVPQ